jgi:secondary thiamine-phosphate synthase enzyme
MAATWAQRSITLGAKKRGCHLVHDEIARQVAADLAQFEVGLCHVFLQHTSASLTINENADPTVRADMEAVLNRLVPEGPDYKHDDEGPDDMPGHVKASLFGCSVTVPITGGRLALGTWQGVWLCEHRAHGGPRSLVVTMQGAPRAAVASGPKDGGGGRRHGHGHAATGSVGGSGGAVAAGSLL